MTRTRIAEGLLHHLFNNAGSPYFPPPPPIEPEPPPPGGEPGFLHIVNPKGGVTFETDMDDYLGAVAGLNQPTHMRIYAQLTKSNAEFAADITEHFTRCDTYNILPEFSITYPAANVPAINPWWQDAVLANAFDEKMQDLNAQIISNGIHYVLRYVQEFIGGAHSDVVNLLDPTGFVAAWKHITDIITAGAAGPLLDGIIWHNNGQAAGLSDVFHPGPTYAHWNGFTVGHESHQNNLAGIANYVAQADRLGMRGATCPEWSPIAGVYKGAGNGVEYPNVENLYFTPVMNAFATSGIVGATYRNGINDAGAAENTRLGLVPAVKTRFRELFPSFFA